MQDNFPHLYKNLTFLGFFMFLNLEFASLFSYTSPKIIVHFLYVSYFSFPWGQTLSFIFHFQKSKFDPAHVNSPIMFAVEAQLQPVLGPCYLQPREGELGLELEGEVGSSPSLGNSGSFSGPHDKENQWPATEKQSRQKRPQL